MKKNIFNVWILTALVCGLSLSVTSCKDDDDNNNDNEVMADEPTDEAVKAWSWVSVMTDETTPETGWQSKSYPVTIGEQSSNDETARLIIVADLDDAKANFASISGCAPEELSGSLTVSAGDFGSLAWNISEQGAPNIATVDVNSPLLKTTRLIYCTEEQVPDNAADITGNCYYRLGDVIEDADGFYWVCVQPSFLGKKNKDSYWVNIFNAAESGRGEISGKLPGIPTANIYSKYNNLKKYNNNTILLPTGLKENRQQIFNLCNLVWALLNTNYYFNQIGNASNGIAGLPIKYHGRTYLRLLGEKWDKNGIFEKLFNHTREEMEQLDGMHFFYKGYHWKQGTTAGVWVYNTAEYKQNYSGSVKGDDILLEMTKAGYGFDVRRYASDPKQNENCASTGKVSMAPAKQFAEGHGYWVVRVRTGDQIDSKYDPYKQMAKTWDIINFNNTEFGVIYKSGAKSKPVDDTELANDEAFEKEYGN